MSTTWKEVDEDIRDNFTNWLRLLLPENPDVAEAITAAVEFLEKCDEVRTVEQLKKAFSQEWDKAEHVDVTQALEDLSDALNFDF